MCIRDRLHAQPRLHHGRQLGVVELAGLRPATAQLGLLLAYFPGRRPVAAEPLRRSSRLTVAGERPIPTAIARPPAPPRRKSAICNRSSKDRYRPERTGRCLGISPPAAWRHLRPVARCTPAASQAAVSVEPPAINTQNRTCLTISSFFVDIHNTSYQNGCCDDRLNSPFPCDTSCQHDQRATNLLGWPSLVSLAARQLSRPLGKHDMCVAENALVEASVRIRVRVDVDVDAQGAGAPCDGC